MTSFEFDGACMVGLMCVILVCLYVYDGTSGCLYMLLHVCVGTCICVCGCECACKC